MLSRALARDPERCRAMGAAGRRQVEALFDSKQNVTVLEELFRAARAGLFTPNPPSSSVSKSAMSKEADA